MADLNIPPAPPTPPEIERAIAHQRRCAIPRRQAIAIAATSYGDANNRLIQTLVALCNDGTLWEIIEGRWVQLPEIPQ